MEHKKVIKGLGIMGIIFMSLSITEIIFIVVMNFIEFDINGNSLILSEFIYGSTYISLTGTFLWLFLISSTVLFLIVGFCIFKVSKNDKIISKSLAKLIVVIGMVILIGAFIKMNYLVLLGKTKISTLSGPIRFQAALYDFGITSIAPALIWVALISFNCTYMVAALVITGVGIKWSLLIEELTTIKE
ncbi:MAG: hypothetical protein ACXABO_04280 [Promethearchaeota archaeon]|jgi:hypothetical protein